MLVYVWQIFFHNFFSRKKERSKAKSAKVGKRKNIVGESEEDGSEEGSEESDDESEEEGEDQDEEANDSDSENEAEIWKVSLHVMSFTLTKIIFCSS